MKRMLIVLILFFGALGIAWFTHDPARTCPPRQGIVQSLGMLSSITCSAVGGAFFATGNVILGIPFVMAPAIIEFGARLYQGCGMQGALGTAAMFGLTMGLLFVPIGGAFVALTYPYYRYRVFARFLGAAILAASSLIGAWWLGGR